MNLEHLAESLPNGLHDMFVAQMRLDFVGRVATFDVSIWTGDVGTGAEEDRDARRSAELILTGLQFCIIEAPDPAYPYARPEPLWFVDPADPDAAVTGALPLPPGAFSSRFFVNQWNAFVHVAALGATLVWK